MYSRRAAVVCIFNAHIESDITQRDASAQHKHFQSNVRWRQQFHRHHQQQQHKTRRTCVSETYLMRWRAVSNARTTTTRHDTWACMLGCSLNYDFNNWRFHGFRIDSMCRFVAGGWACLPACRHGSVLLCPELNGRPPVRPTAQWTWLLIRIVREHNKQTTMHTTQQKKRYAMASVVALRTERKSKVVAVCVGRPPRNVYQGRKVSYAMFPFVCAFKSHTTVGWCQRRAPPAILLICIRPPHSLLLLHTFWF